MVLNVLLSGVHGNENTYADKTLSFDVIIEKIDMPAGDNCIH